MCPRSRRRGRPRCSFRSQAAGNGRADQADVAEALRKVAEELVGRRIDLLREEADVVNAADEVVHKDTGFVGAADPRERFGEPERANEERALLAAQPVLAAV